MNHNSNDQPLCDHDRKQLLHSLSMGLIRVSHKLAGAEPLLSPESANYFAHRSELSETVTLAGLLLSLTIRGATARDIARYATTGHGDLPFQGCEQALFDCLLTAMFANVEPPASATQVATECTAVLEQVLTLVTEETGITRPVICQLIRPANDNE